MFSVVSLDLVLSASDHRPTLPYSHTYSQRQIHTPRVISSLPSVVLTHGITHGSLSPECLWCVSQRHFFFNRLFVWYQYVFMWYMVWYICITPQIKYLLALPGVRSVLCKHVICCCTTILCRLVEELCFTNWQAYTKRVVPHTDSIAPTESHKERYRSSSHPDCCLYAVLAFIGYTWSRMLCATAAVRLRTVVCVLFFRLFSRAWLVCFRSSATTALLAHVHTAANASPKGTFLSAGRGADTWYHEWILLPRVLLVRLSASFFFIRLFVWYVFMWHDVSASHRKYQEK